MSADKIEGAGRLPGSYPWDNDVKKSSFKPPIPVYKTPHPARLGERKKAQNRLQPNEVEIIYRKFGRLLKKEGGLKDTSQIILNTFMDLDPFQQECVMLQGGITAFLSECPYINSSGMLLYLKLKYPPELDSPEKQSLEDEVFLGYSGGYQFPMSDTEATNRGTVTGTGSVRDSDSPYISTDIDDNRTSISNSEKLKDMRHSPTIVFEKIANLHGIVLDDKETTGPDEISFDNNEYQESNGSTTSSKSSKTIFEDRAKLHDISVNESEKSDSIRSSEVALYDNQVSKPICLNVFEEKALLHGITINNTEKDFISELYPQAVADEMDIKELSNSFSKQLFVTGSEDKRNDECDKYTETESLCCIQSDKISQNINTNNSNHNSYHMTHLHCDDNNAKSSLKESAAGNAGFLNVGATPFTSCLSNQTLESGYQNNASNINVTTGTLNSGCSTNVVNTRGNSLVYSEFQQTILHQDASPQPPNPAFIHQGPPIYCTNNMVPQTFDFFALLSHPPPPHIPHSAQYSPNTFPGFPQFTTLAPTLFGPPNNAALRFNHKLPHVLPNCARFPFNQSTSNPTLKLPMPPFNSGSQQFIAHQSNTSCVPQQSITNNKSVQSPDTNVLADKNICSKPSNFSFTPNNVSPVIDSQPKFNMNLAKDELVSLLSSPLKKTICHSLKKIQKQELTKNTRSMNLLLQNSSSDIYDDENEDRVKESTNVDNKSDGWIKNDFFKLQKGTVTDINNLSDNASNIVNTVIETSIGANVPQTSEVKISTDESYGRTPVCHKETNTVSVKTGMCHKETNTVSVSTEMCHKMTNTVSVSTEMCHKMTNTVSVSTEMCHKMTNTVSMSTEMCHKETNTVSVKTESRGVVTQDIPKMTCHKSTQTTKTDDVVLTRNDTSCQTSPSKTQDDIVPLSISSGWSSSTTTDSVTANFSTCIPSVLTQIISEMDPVALQQVVSSHIVEKNRLLNANPAIIKAAVFQQIMAAINRNTFTEAPAATSRSFTDVLACSSTVSCPEVESLSYFNSSSQAPNLSRGSLYSCRPKIKKPLRRPKVATKLALLNPNQPDSICIKESQDKKTKSGLLDNFPEYKKQKLQVETETVNEVVKQTSNPAEKEVSVLSESAANNAPSPTKKRCSPSSKSKALSPNSKSNFEKLVERVMTTFSFANRCEAIKLVKQVRKSRNGTLVGMSMSDILEAATLIFNSKNDVKIQGIQTCVANAVKVEALTPVKKSTPQSTEEAECDCAICFESLKCGPLRKLDCGHTYHEVCIKLWIYGEESTCPICRRYSIFREDYPKLC